MRIIRTAPDLRWESFCFNSHRVWCPACSCALAPSFWKDEKCIRFQWLCSVLAIHKKSIPYVLDGNGDADNDIDAIWDSGHLLVENWQPKQHFGQSHHLCWPGQHMLQLSSIRRNICGKIKDIFVELFWSLCTCKDIFSSSNFGCIFKTNVLRFPNSPLFWSFEAGECFGVLVAFSK